MPQIIGGTTLLRSTEVTVIQLDPTANKLAIGGSSTDTDLVAGATVATSKAFIMIFDSSSASYIWSNAFTNSAVYLSTVSSISWSPDSNLLIASFKASAMAAFTLFNAATGAVIQDFSSSTINLAFGLSSIYVDNAGNIYFTAKYVQTINTRSMFAKIDTGTTSTSFAYYISNTNSVISSTLFYNSATTNFYIGGNVNSVVGISCFSNTGSLVWSYGQTSPRSVIKIHVYATGGFTYVRGCYDSANLGFVEVKVSSTDVYSSSVRVEDQANSNVLCRAIYGSAQYTSYMLVSNQNASPYENKIVRIDSATWHVFYTPLETFSTAYQVLNDGLFLGVGVYYYAGQADSALTNNPSAGSSSTFARTSGYVMSSNPTSPDVTLMSNTESTSFHSIISYGGMNSYTPSPSSTSLSFSSQITSAAMVATSLNQICSSGTTVVPSTITGPSYTYSQLQQTFTFPAFTYTPTGGGYTFAYSATGLPTCGSLSGNSIVLTTACTGSTITTYSVVITGTLSHASETGTSSFTITLNPSTLTPSTISTQSFYFYQLPQTITFPVFTQAPSSSATFTYTATGLPSCATINSGSHSITLANTCTGSTSASYSVVVTGTLSCGGSTSSSFTINLNSVGISGSISDQDFYFIALPQTINFGEFAQSPNSGLTLSYSASGMPSCGSISGTIITFSNSCTGTSTQMHSIYVTGTLSTGESHITSFTLLLNPAIITPSTVPSVSYNYQSMPQSFTFPDFTYSPAVGGLTFTYTANGLITCESINSGAKTINLVGCTIAETGSAPVTITGVLSTGESATTSTFYITISSTTVTATTIQDQVFDNAQLPAEISYSAFTYSPLSSDTFTYTATGLPTCMSITASTGVISIPLSCQVSFSTTYSVMVTGTITSGSASTSPTFLITLTCSPPVITASSISPYSYTIGSGALIVQFDQFQQSLSCSTYTFTYTSTLDDGSSLSSIPLSLNAKSLEYTIKSSDTGDAGSYTVKLTATLNDSPTFTTASITWDLTILSPSFPYYISTNQSASSSSYSIKNSTNSSTLTNSSNSSNQSANSTSFTEVGSTSSTSSSSLSSLSQLDQQLAEFIQSHQPKKNFPNVTAKITSLTRAGLMIITFTEQMLPYNNYSTFNDSVMNITISAEEEQPQTDLEFNWECTAFANTTMTVQMNFTYPINVSRTPVHYFFIFQIINSVNVDFQSEYHFLTLDGYISIPMHYQMNKYIPQQMVDDGNLFQFDPFQRQHRLSHLRLKLLPVQ